MTLGFEVLVQLVIAAMTTDPCSRTVSVATAAPPPDVRLDALFQVGQRGSKRALGLAERHAILRPPRARQARVDRRQIEFHRLAVGRIGRRVGSEQALRFGVRLDQRDLRGLAAGQPQVVERHRVDRENRDGGAVLRAHVAEGHAIRDRQVREPGP